MLEIIIYTIDKMGIYGINSPRLVVQMAIKFYS